MKYSFHIRDKTTEEVRVFNDSLDYQDTPEYSDGGLMAYMWLEGNFSCDCNRGRFFDSAGGVESDTRYPCNTGADDQRFELVRIVREDGTDFDFTEWM